MFQPPAHHNQVEAVFQNPQYDDYETDYDTALLKVKGQVGRGSLPVDIAETGGKPCGIFWSVLSAGCDECLGDPRLLPHA